MSARLLVVGVAVLVAFSVRPAAADRAARLYRSGAEAELVVERIGSEHGLAHNAVRAILEDHEGFLWFGTEDGLQRYDGVEFETYRAGSDALALSHSRVEALLETEDGALWIATAGGLDRLSPDRLAIQRVTLEDADAPFAVLSLDISPDGRLSAATADHGLLVVDGAEGGDPRLRAVPEVPWTLAYHAWIPQAGLFVVRRQQDAWHYAWLDSQLRELAHSPFGHTIGISQSGAEVRAAGLDDRRLALLGHLLEGGRWIAGTAVEPVEDFAWIGTVRPGLFLQPLDGRPASRVKLRGQPEELTRLSHEILSLARDRAGTLWIGTYGGLLRADPARRIFEQLPRGPRDGDYAVSSLAASPQSPGRLVAGTFGGGLVELAMDDGRQLRRLSPADLTGGRCSDYVWSVARSSESLVIVASGGVCVLDRSWKLRGFVPGYFRTIAAADPSSDSFWVAGAETLELKADCTVVGRHLLVSEAILAIGGDEVWLASPVSQPREPQLTRLDPATGEHSTRPLPVQAVVYEIALSTPGVLLLATSDGLLSFDTSTEATRNLIPASLIGTVYSIQLGSDSEHWLGTSRGIARVDLELESPLVALYDTGEGLGNTEFNRRARYLAQSGRIFLGGMSGITAFDPSRIGRNELRPLVRLKRVAIEGPDGVRTVSRSEPATLRPDDYAVSFDFAALNFTRADLNRYRYRLRGVDLEWVDAASRRSARYAGLSPGEHLFEVLGSNNDGVWSPVPATIALRVLPPFYVTWWFRSLVVTAIGAFLIWLYRLRVGRLLELERMRLRIATDLHDELGSELSGIALASAVVGRSSTLEEEDRGRLRDVEQTSRRVMEGLRDIVWYVNPEHDSFDSLVDRMRATARSLSDEIEVSLELDGVPRVSGLDMQARRQLFLAFKELVYNAVRHSGGRRVLARLATSGGSLEMTVEDDGNGFDPKASAGGTGLGSVRRRVERLGGVLDVQSTAAVGTRAVVRIPLT